MAVNRKGVLLRFRPDLLERVDESAGVVDRHPFLMDLIEEALDARDAAAEMVPDDGPAAIPYGDTFEYNDRHWEAHLGAGRN